jgi:hypothetical protein
MQRKEKAATLCKLSARRDFQILALVTSRQKHFKAEIFKVFFQEQMQFPHLL